MFFGKVVGGLLGITLGGPIGAIVGVALGHFFDRGLSKFRPELSAEDRAHAEQVFFSSVFQLMGHVAKADGRVSEQEVARAEEIMAHMQLSTAMRAKAIEYFKKGGQTDFDLPGVVGEFNSIGNKLPSLRQTLLTYLINIALADGQIDDAEEECLGQISEHLGVSKFAFKQLMAMLRAQAQFYQQQQRHGSQPYTPSKDELALAYESLGVASDASDPVVKKAYRKLMSENHPDKLQGQGVPQEMIEMATERAQKIQAAYDLIKKYRKTQS
ncbi:co-chaperone DjlA [Sessilibacter sp. MAH2]